MNTKMISFDFHIYKKKTYLLILTHTGIYDELNLVHTTIAANHEKIIL